MEVQLRSNGGPMEVQWRSNGGPMVVQYSIVGQWPSNGGSMAERTVGLDIYHPNQLVASARTIDDDGFILNKICLEFGYGG